MIAIARHLPRYALGLVAALLAWGAAASAQQTFDVPAPPPSQSQQPFHYRPKPTPHPLPPPVERYQPTAPATPLESVAPTPTVTPPPETLRMEQPALPAIFRGCWQGDVPFLDSIERLPGGAKIGTWTPKTYRLCYERYGNGPFQLTFTEAGVVHNRKITNAQGSMSLVATDGRTYATMRAELHFDEYRNGGGYFSDATFAVDETTRLQCDIQPDGMHVIGSVRGSREGEPWFRAYWHATFVHVPG